MAGKRIMPRKTAGDEWRVQGTISAVNTAALGPFDEIVVARRQGEAWLHVEMLHDNSAFVQLVDRYLWIHIPARGAPTITMEETREWKPFKRCQKRPEGRRCICRRGHDGKCFAREPPTPDPSRGRKAGG